MNTSIYILLAAQIFSILVGIVAYKRNSISVSGLIALLVTSSLFIWLNQVALLIILFSMFASSSFLSHYKKSKKTEFELVVAKHGPRDYIQAIANLGTATLMVLVYHFFENPVFIAALIGSVAAANADSWASEIGGISKRQPVMITTFKPVPKGISGGVTLLGTVGGITGSLFIVCIALISMNLLSPFQGNTTVLFWSGFLSGIAGFIFDSFLGAWSQALYKYKNGEALTENKKGNKELVKGFKWMDNDAVNLLTTLFAALAASGLYLLLK